MSKGTTLPPIATATPTSIYYQVIMEQMDASRSTASRLWSGLTSGGTADRADCKRSLGAGQPCAAGPRSGFAMLKNGAAGLVIIGLLAGCSVSPEPMTRSEIRAQLAADRAQLPARDQVIEGRVDLDRAIVHAVLHNRDLRLRTFEAALSRREVGTTALGMLPELTAEAGYRERDQYAASTSVVLIDGEPDVLPSEPAYSVSSEKETRTSDVTFTWNLLDFGLSYVRAKQRADRHLVEAERERKAIQTIASEVRAAYWKAVSAERVLPRIDPLIADAKAALAQARALEEDRAVAPRAALERQRNLLDVLRLLQDLKTALAGAKVELAELMGLHPTAEFTLADARAPDLTIPRLSAAIETLEEAALENRPEMREAQYQTRIAASEARAAMLKLLPGLRLTRSNSYEDNKYLLNQNWSTLGASVNFNLFNIFAIEPTSDRAEAREALAEERRLATAITVLAQVHLSAVEFAERKDAYALSEEYLDVADRIVEQALARVETDSAGSVDLIRDRLNRILAEIRRDRAYADMQSSFGRVLDSAGIDLFPTDYRDVPPEALTTVVAQRFEQIASGELPFTPQPAQAEQQAAEDAARRAAEQAAAEEAAAQEAAAEKALAEDPAASRTSEAETADAGGPAPCRRRVLVFCVEREDRAVEGASDMAGPNSEPIAAQSTEAGAAPSNDTDEIVDMVDDALAAEPDAAAEGDSATPLSAIDWL